MRFASGILLSTAFLLLSIDGQSQNPCSARAGSREPGEEPPTVSEDAHRALLVTPPAERRHLIPGDVELILKCGTERDAAELFADLRNRSVSMVGGTVVEAGKDFVRLAFDDGFDPHLAAFRFNFDGPIRAVPVLGEKIVISGTYFSYSREPFQINMTNADFEVFRPHIAVVRPLSAAQ